MFTDLTPRAIESGHPPLIRASPTTYKKCQVAHVSCRIEGETTLMLWCREIAEVAGIDERDILYISPSNEALAHLPYMIALDK